MKPKIQLLFDRVLIKPMSEDTLSAGGIILPDQDEKPSTKGVVIITGKGTKLRPITTVKEGDIVLYGPHSGAELILDDGVTYLIMRETEISMVMGSVKK